MRRLAMHFGKPCLFAYVLVGFVASEDALVAASMTVELNIVYKRL